MYRATDFSCHNNWTAHKTRWRRWKKLPPDTWFSTTIDSNKTMWFYICYFNHIRSKSGTCRIQISTPIQPCRKGILKKKKLCGANSDMLINIDCSSECSDPREYVITSRTCRWRDSWRLCSTVEFHRKTELHSHSSENVNYGCGLLNFINAILNEAIRRRNEYKCMKRRNTNFFRWVCFWHFVCGYLCVTCFHILVGGHV